MKKETEEKDENNLKAKNKDTEEVNALKNHNNYLLLRIWKEKF